MTTCLICGADPCINPTFCAPCRRADRAAVKHDDPRLQRLRQLLPRSVSPERAWHELNRTPGRAATSTVEAVMFSLRERGVKALDETGTRHRLAQLSEEQVIEVGDRLQRIKPEIAQPWSVDEVETLVKHRETLR
jgi:hypothetical protein